MSGQHLQPGDWATTDYNNPRRPELRTRVRIIERTEGESQSGILFRVAPALRGNPPDEWFDAAWFEPAGAPEGMA